MTTLHNAPSRSRELPDPQLARTLWQWLALGVVAMLLVPAARGPVYLLGNMPFWLLIAPGLGLLTIYRHSLAAAWRARLVRATPRRRRGAVKNGVGFSYSGRPRRARAYLRAHN